MLFEKYSSIENSYRSEFLNELVQEGASAGCWVVQEKIHGANFAIYTDGHSAIAARRTAFLGSDENFFSSSHILAKYEARLRSMFFACGTTNSLVIHCELFGGSYPHKDVPINHKASAIQKGVYYSPDTELMVFDIRIDGTYCGVDEVVRLCEIYKIPFIPIRYRGSYEECLKYPNAFQSSISDVLGLPSIPDNTCEGVVIKPREVKFLKNGCRVILKNKNELFAEKSSKPKHMPESLPNGLAAIVEDISLFITTNRLRCVLSKIGAVTNKDFGRILGLFAQDVLADFRKESDILSTVSKKDQMIIFKKINRLSACMIRDNLSNIVDGNF